MNRITTVLRDLRAQNRKTQEYMAMKLGISQSQYNKIERGDKALNFELLSRIATLLNTTPKQLYLSIYEEEQIKKYSFEDKTEVENQEYYKRMAVYFEKKFLKVYRKYIEMYNSQQQNVGIIQRNVQL